MRYIAALLCLFALVGCSHPIPEYESHYTEPPPENAGVPVAIIGDSYTGGTPLGGKGPQSWPEDVQRTLASEGVLINPRVGFEGGSGYVNRRNANGHVFIDQVPDVVAPDVKAIVIFGSRNDIDVPAPELTRWVQRTMDMAVQRAPGVPLIIIGPPWVNGNPPPGILQARDIVRDGALAHQAIWVDPLADRWFVDRPDLIASDGIHPTDAGHAYMAERIAPVIKNALQPAPVS
ncbi:SGNH/GDSL hydrolase family protein [Mycolicibacterium sp. 018/SC-01/001]|uniref:SGNH/GDSL hydrolase family protein n=1 Tax=Mycolicibacterium sp. 018/SC-01/001 TaxID=2592069 RepID=UPI00163D7695|nr:SGNH/GDSL hydrolase family protein [Mycolicibacterium sp. 018/SC-01/001]